MRIQGMFRPSAVPRAERYRGLRGVVRHITRIPDDPEKQRNPLGRLGEIYPDGYEKPAWGICKWCQQPAERSHTGHPRKWHDGCLPYAFAAQGSPNGFHAIRGDLVEIENPYGGTSERRRCPACGKAEYVQMELDHILAIGVARRLGLHYYRRAFLPENVWWICEPCHKVKTAFDRALMRALESRVTVEEETAPTYTPVPLFEWAAERSGISDGGD